VLNVESLTQGTSSWAALGATTDPDPGIVADPDPGATTDADPGIVADPVRGDNDGQEAAL